MASSKRIILAKHSSGEIEQDNFRIDEREIDKVEVGNGDVLVRNLFLSVDPWNRLCMHSTNQGLYYPPFAIGEVITSIYITDCYKGFEQPLPVLSVAEVVFSDNSGYRAGELVTGLANSSEYTLFKGGIDGAGMAPRKIEDANIPLDNYLSFLGLPGFTAWVGIVKIGQAKAGEQVFVTAASGGVGLAACQIAKRRGCRVVGSAGSDEKVQLLKEEYGCDDAFNYKTETDWNTTLGRLFPNGIDIYFDNVGGKMLEAVLNHINHHARIPISGMISQYNNDWKLAYGVRTLMNLVGRCAKLEGFLAYDNLGGAEYTTFISEMIPQVAKGDIISKNSITTGLENFPKAFIGMMRGENIGKAIVQM